MTTYRLTEIEPDVLGDHGHLAIDDDCYYFGEWTAYRNYSHSPTNQLIYNLKWAKSKHWYNDATATIAEHISALGNLKGFTFVPVPPSKVKSDPDYNDRLLDILKRVKKDRPEIDFREVVTQKASMIPSHQSTTRPTPAQLQNNYSVDQSLLSSARDHIVIFDDIITAGAHYRAMVSALFAHRSGLKFTGLFIARRVFPG